MIKILLTLICFIWPLGQLALFFPILGQNVLILDLLLSLLWIFLCFSIFKQIKTDPLTKPLLLFGGVLAVTLIINFNLIGLFYLLRLLSPFSLYFAAKYTKISPRLIYFSLFSFVLLGLAQYFLFPYLSFLKNIGFDDHYFRLVGTLFDPNFTGLILAQIIFVCFFVFKNKAKFWLSLPLLALALTFSRASYLAFLSSVIYLIFSQKRKFILVLLLLGLLLFVYLSPKPYGEGVNLWRTFSIYSRLENSRIALDFFLQKPLFGWGLGLLPRISNSFIYVLASTGLVGFSIFIYFLSRICLLSRTNRLLTTLLLTSLVHSLFNNSYFYLFEAVFFNLALGLTLKRKVKS